MPFTAAQFLDVFAIYNRSIWPLQLVAYVVAAVPVWGVIRRTAAWGRAALWALAALWIWTGVVYHMRHFASINSAAWGFGATFVIQGAVMVWVTRHAGAFRLRRVRGAWSCLGWATMAYGALVYPIIGLWAGHGYPRVPLFGVTPCPTTIFTLGVLLHARPTPRRLALIPVLWSVVGTSAAVNLGVPQDYGLGLAAALVLVKVVRENWLAGRDAEKE
jgi:hypothetical protein